MKDILSPCLLDDLILECPHACCPGWIMPDDVKDPGLRKGCNLAGHFIYSSLHLIGQGSCFIFFCRDLAHCSYGLYNACQIIRVDDKGSNTLFFQDRYHSASMLLAGQDQVWMEG
ncbi:Uncharacterised protein [uncultured archaeon]|nr:Uncharacterised protein [uncultured archaeon]